MTDASPSLVAPAATRRIPPDLNETLFRLCATTAPLPGHATLLDALRRAGGPEFMPRLSRGGWFRPGRILGTDGRCVADDALAWLEQAWLDAGADGENFIDRHADAGLMLSLQQGISHYLVAPWGPGASEFLQLEIEELQEFVSHPLASAGEPPLTVEALLDHPPGAPAPVPLGAPRYALRRLTDIAQFVERIAGQAGKPAPVLRFLADWEASSAGPQGRFCDHWVLALTEHLDRYRQPRCGATPVAAHAPAWSGASANRGTALAHDLHDFDRAAGYGFAWYFHMVSGRRVPHALAPLVAGDLGDGMAYLPERDTRIVFRWVHEPYTV